MVLGQDIVIKKYNYYAQSTRKFILNQVFYFNSDNVFFEVLENMKN